MNDLAPDYLAIVEHILAEHVPKFEVWAFGSRATWTGTDYSDLDLAVVGDSPLHWRTRSRLKEAFEESLLPMQVDVLDWHSIPNEFREKIIRNHLIVQKGAKREGWHKVTLGEFAPFKYGKSLPASRRIPSGQIPVFGSNGIIGYHNKALTEGPTVIIGRKGTAGAVHFSPVPCWPIDTTFYLTGTEPELMRFKYFALSSLGLEGMNSDSAVPGLNRLSAHARELTVPEETEQQRIAQVLGTLDDKIEVNRRMCETLEEMARALFKSWFVNFDPVRAKMEGRWHPGESLPGLPAELYDLFPDRLVDSELGPIPQDWDVKGLDSIADFTNGLALQRFPPEGDEALPVIKIAEMRRGFTNKTGMASPNIDQRYVVKDGDVLFSWSGSLKVVLWSRGPGALNQHLFKVTSDLFPRWFYLGWLYEHLDAFRGIAAGKATTMGHIRRQHLADAKVVVPPRGLLTAANTPLTGLVEQQVSHTVGSRTLVTLRDTLLPKLVSGQLRLGATETVGA